MSSSKRARPLAMLIVAGAGCVDDAGSDASRSASAITTITYKAASIAPSSVGPDGAYQMNCDYEQIVDCTE